MVELDDREDRLDGLDIFIVRQGLTGQVSRQADREFPLDGQAGKARMGEPGPRWVAPGVEEAAEDGFIDPELCLDGSAGATDLVTDDSFTVRFAQASHLAL